MITVHFLCNAFPFLSLTEGMIKKGLKGKDKERLSTVIMGLERGKETNPCTDRFVWVSHRVFHYLCHSFLSYLKEKKQR